MSGGIYVLKENRELVTLSERPYDSEDLLQTLLEKYPSILAGDQINPAAPRKWLLIRREAGVPAEQDGSNRWSLDHLFVDQDGIPTLVEVKRSSDTRIRREVIGQMLDYAANAWAYWSIESILASFEMTCADRKESSQSVLEQFLGPDHDHAVFWQTVRTNLKAGRFRLLFVADEIPEELRRVIEFLNVQMDPTEVLGVEIKQFVGGSLTTLVPRVVGQTAEALARKGGTQTTRQWDEASFFAELESRVGAEQTSVARKLFHWAQSQTDSIYWGKGARSGSFLPIVECGDDWHNVFGVWTYGVVETHFQYYANRKPFASAERRREVLDQLNRIPGVSLPADSIDRRPSIPLELLEPEPSLRQFFNTMAWYVEEVRKSYSPSRVP